MKADIATVIVFVVLLIAFVFLMLYAWGERSTVANYCLYNGYEKMQLIDGNYYCQTGNEFVPVEWME